MKILNMYASLNGQTEKVAREIEQTSGLIKAMEPGVKAIKTMGTNA